MGKSHKLSKLLSLFAKLSLLIFFFETALAGPGQTTYQARIIKPNGVALEASNVAFRFTILNPDADCVLYSESFSGTNMTNTQGLVSFSLGSGIKNYPTSATTFEQVFSNATPFLSCNGTSPASYSPAADDNRKIVMQFNDGFGWQTMPAMSINAVPYAMYASDSALLQGLNKDNFVQVSTIPNCAASYALTYTGSGFSCILANGGGSGGGSVTSGDITAALGYTPASGASFSALSSSVTSDLSMVSSTLASFQTATAVSFSALSQVQELKDLTNAYSNSSSLYIGDNTVTSGTANNNTGVGQNVMRSMTNGSENVAMGESALTSNTTGFANTAIGWYALYENLNGGNNTAIGNESMSNNVNGFENTGIGSFSLIDNVSGNYNTALGSSALSRNTTGHRNTGVGVVTGFHNQTGHHNVFVGEGSGYGVFNSSNVSGSTFVGFGTGANIRTGGDFNILVGYQTGNNLTTGSRNILIGHDIDLTTPTASQSLSIGNLIFGTGLDGTGSALSNGYIGIGVTTPVTKLDVSGGLRISMESASCNAALAGTLRYNNGQIEFCNSTLWTTLGAAGAGITSLGGSTSSTQSFANVNGGTAPTFVSANGIHTLNIPFASAAPTTAGLISNADYVNFSNKITSSAASVSQVLGYAPVSASTLTNYVLKTGDTMSGRLNLPSNGLAVGSSQFVVSSTRVGIATANPLVGFHAATGDRGAMFSGLGNTGVIINAAAGNNPDLLLQQAGVDRWIIGHDHNINSLAFRPGLAGPIMQISASAPSYVLVVSGSGQVGIGTNAPTANLDIAGTLRIRGGSPGLGRVLASDASGNATWTTITTGAVSVSDLLDAYSTDTSIYIGAGSVSSGTADYNTSLGISALASNTTGALNTAVGQGALEMNTTGVTNSAFGWWALNSNVSGDDNIAIGSESLSQNINGDMNVSIGNYAMIENVSGSQNVAIGSSALSNAVSGNSNVAVGYNAGASLVSGQDNVFVGKFSGLGSASYAVLGNVTMGYRAGAMIRTGADYNILLGYQAGDNITTGSRNIILGYNIDAAAATASNTLNIGNLIFADNVNGTGSTFSTGNIGIGTSVTTARLDISGTIRIRGGAPGAGKVLTSDANGLASWQMPSTGSSSATPFTAGQISVGTSATTYAIEVSGTAAASRTIAVAGTPVMYMPVQGTATGQLEGSIAFGNGLRSAVNVTGPLQGRRNTSVGIDALFYNTTGSENTAVGYSALSWNEDGFSNSAFGSLALEQNASGSRNSAFGANALAGSYDGNDNTAVGYLALNSNYSGDFNTAIGQNSLAINSYGNRNTAVGSNALYNNFNNSNNTAVGESALWANSTGSNNVALGRNAGYYLSNGVTGNASSSGSVYIGADTRSSVVSATNEVVIGNGAIGNGTNSVTLGSSSITKTILRGNVGLGGVLNPAAALTVSGSMYVGSGTVNYNGESGVIAGYTPSGSHLVFDMNSTNLARMTYAGTTMAMYKCLTTNCSSYSGGIIFDLADSRQIFNNAGTQALPAINIGIGQGNGFFAPSINNLALTTSGTERLRITSAGNVGIGTTAPVSKLHLHDNGVSSALEFFTNSTTGASVTDGSYAGINSLGQLTLWNQENLPILFGTNNGERMRIDNAGNVGIGTTAPTSALEVSGTIKATDLVLTSDRRAKFNIASLHQESELARILKVDPVSFNWIYNKKPDLGFIAQDIEKIYPEAVVHSDKDDSYAVKYTSLIAPIISSIKELFEKITGQEKELGNLKSEVEELKKLVLEQNKTIEKMKKNSERVPAYEKK